MHPAILLMVAAMQPQSVSLPKPSSKILALSTGEILSLGGGLRFDEEGLQIIGHKVPLQDSSFMLGDKRFEASPDFWAMVERNRRDADAKQHVQVREGKLFHDGQPVSMDLIKIKGIHEAIFWEDWVVCIGLTSKSGVSSLTNPEPIELIYYNWKTRKGGSIGMGGKHHFRFWVLTK
jgi:hypothetical protein